jgi:nicotinamide mononucleotide adenylyltransferase
MGITGAYLGRFQMFALHHRSVVEEICANYALDVLYVMVADWPERTQENPLTASEAIQIAKLSLTNLGVRTEIRVLPFPLTPNQDFEAQVGIGLERFNLDLTFSGSSSTLKALRRCAGVLGFTVVELLERGSCHSTDIRRWIARGDAQWKNWMAPEAVKFIESLSLAERLEALGTGAKRPWAEAKH